MAYIPEITGYVADVPNVHYKRCDGEVFYFDEISSASFTPSDEKIEFTGGHSQYPNAFIPAGNTLEVQMTSSQFSMSLFEMANVSDISTDSAYKRYKTAEIVAQAKDEVLIEDPNAAITDISIRGFKLVTTTPATAGEFQATAVAETGTPPNVVPAHVKLTFFANSIDKDKVIQVTYHTVKSASVLHMTNTSNASTGEMILEWPVYTSGADCSDSAIKGYIIITVYRARVTGMPGFDSSYKTAGSNSITVSAIDPKRIDGRAYTVAYVEA